MAQGNRGPAPGVRCLIRCSVSTFPRLTASAQPALSVPMTAGPHTRREGGPVLSLWHFRRQRHFNTYVEINAQYPRHYSVCSTYRLNRTTTMAPDRCQLIYFLQPPRYYSYFPGAHKSNSSPGSRKLVGSGLADPESQALPSTCLDTNG